MKLQWYRLQAGEGRTSGGRTGREGEVTRGRAVIPFGLWQLGTYPVQVYRVMDGANVLFTVGKPVNKFHAWCAWVGEVVGGPQRPGVAADAVAQSDSLPALRLWCQYAERGADGRWFLPVYSMTNGVRTRWYELASEVSVRTGGTWESARTVRVAPRLEG